MSARDDIIGRVRRGVAKADYASRRAAAEAALGAPVRGPQPVMATDLVARFKAKAEYLASTVDVVVALTDVPMSVDQRLGPAGRCDARRR